MADALALGCLLAGYRHLLDRSPAYLRFLRSAWFSLVPVVLVSMHLALSIAAFSDLIGEALLNLSIALIIDRCIRFPDDAFGRFLNSRAMVFAGTLSYSLYLWQQPFLNRQSPVSR